MADGYLMFLSKPTGYTLVEREGDVPAAGAEVANGEETVRILKVGPSPIPGDRRPCVFTEPST